MPCRLPDNDLQAVHSAVPRKSSLPLPQALLLPEYCQSGYLQNYGSILLPDHLPVLKEPPVFHPYPPENPENPARKDFLPSPSQSHFFLLQTPEHTAFSEYHLFFFAGHLYASVLHPVLPAEVVSWTPAHPLAHMPLHADSGSGKQPSAQSQMHILHCSSYQTAIHIPTGSAQ